MDPNGGRGGVVRHLYLNQIESAQKYLIRPDVIRDLVRPCKALWSLVRPDRALQILKTLDKASWDLVKL